MPHGHCFFWRSDILWLHIVSDAAIVLAYYSIPIMLLYFRKRRKDLPYPWMFALFAGFIFWCGTTHLLNIVTMWVPMYRLDGVAKLITALISVVTAVKLFPLIPQALDLRSPRELEEKNRELEDSKIRRRELENFAHIASHDLKEPLRTISLFSDMLKRKAGNTLEPEVKEYLTHISAGSQRLSELIEDLATYSRLDLDRVKISQVTLQECLEKAIENIQRSIKESNAQIVSSFEVEAMKIVAVPSQIVQLFQNLLTNAIKFTKTGETPKILVRAVKSGKDWKVSVSDQGIGFDPAYKDQIFLVFKRLHGVDGGYPGTGMGLAICKRVVEQHHGKIWADSVPHQGSTFTFTIEEASPKSKLLFYNPVVSQT